MCVCVCARAPVVWIFDKSHTVTSRAINVKLRDPTETTVTHKVAFECNGASQEAVPRRQQRRRQR